MCHGIFIYSSTDLSSLLGGNSMVRSNSYRLSCCHSWGFGSKRIVSGKLDPFPTNLHLIKLPWFYLADFCSPGYCSYFGCWGDRPWFSLSNKPETRRQCKSHSLMTFQTILVPCCIHSFSTQPGQGTHNSRGLSYFLNGSRVHGFLWWLWFHQVGYLVRSQQ